MAVRVRPAVFRVSPTKYEVLVGVVATEIPDSTTSLTVTSKETDLPPYWTVTVWVPILVSSRLSQVKPPVMMAVLPLL